MNQDWQTAVVVQRYEGAHWCGVLRLSDGTLRGVSGWYLCRDGTFAEDISVGATVWVRTSDGAVSVREPSGDA